MSNYVDNQVLYDEICKWKQEIRVKGHHVRMPDSIGRAILTIAHGFTGYFKFSGYTRSWKEMMVSDAIESIVKGLVNFDETKYDNPHAYITKACFYAFIQRIKTEKREMSTKYKYFLEHVYDSHDDDMAIIADETFLQDIREKLDTYEASLKPTPKDKTPTLPTLEQFYEEAHP